MDPTEMRAARLAAIRARRGTPERAAVIEQIAAAKVRRAATAAADAAAERAWLRKFDRADLRTQARMLADDGVLCGDDSPLRELLLQAAALLPAGYR